MILFFQNQLNPKFWPSASNFKSFSRSLELFFLTLGQNNFGNKMPFMNYVPTYVFFKNYFIWFFQGPDWQYRTELPAWAKDNWVDPDSL